MLDGLSLDQLRTFIVAVEEGSFSAAARRLRRAQSMVSELIGRLEGQVGVVLFDRSGLRPTLTAHGTVLLADAREIIAKVDFMRARASGMASGVEAELSVVIDATYPIDTVTSAALEFRQRFPFTPLRLFIEALGNSFAPLLDERASLGIVGQPPAEMTSLSMERLSGVDMLMVAAADHPLTKIGRSLSREDLSRHTQLVLTDRSSLSEGKDFFVLSQSTWRLADLFVKRAFMLAGLGWGGMPRHTVADDLAAGRLTVLDIEDYPTDGLVRPMFAAHRTAAPPGPAGRWLIDHLKMAEVGVDQQR